MQREAIKKPRVCITQDRLRKHGVHLDGQVSEEHPLGGWHLEGQDSYHENELINLPTE